MTGDKIRILPTPLLNLWPLIRSEPFRLFFPLGWIAGIIGVTYWILVSLGVTSNYNSLFHGLIQIELFASAFAVGFLLTALPKFLRADSASTNEVFAFLVVYAALAASLFNNALVVAQLFFIALLLLVIRFAFFRLRQRKSSPPDSFLLVGFGLLAGILGAILFIVPSPTFPLLGPKLIEQGMFLSLALGIGSFLGPRLMGLVDATNAVVQLPGARVEPRPGQNNSRIAAFVFGSALLASFVVETGLDRNLGIYLRALAVSFCLYYFGVLKLPRSKSIVGVLISTSLWLMALGLWLAAFLPIHEVSALHITYIGGFGLLILSIGAQVASSHGGDPKFWLVRRPWSILVATLVIISAILRALATHFSGSYFIMLGVAGLCFDIALVLWGLAVIGYFFEAKSSPHLSN